MVERVVELAAGARLLPWLDTAAPVGVTLINPRLPYRSPKRLGQPVIADPETVVGGQRHASISVHRPGSACIAVRDQQRALKSLGDRPVTQHSRR
jgi:hypothetical protein